MPIFSGHTGIYNHTAYAEQIGKNTDGSASVQKVAQHLDGDFLWAAAYAPGDYTVVGGGDDNSPTVQLRPVRAEDPCQLHGDIFQTAETSRRFGKLALSGAGAAHGEAICRADILQSPV